MGKRVIITSLFMTTIILSSCGKSSSPEENIKTTQINVINKMLTKVITKKNIQFTWNVNVNANTPVWWWKLILWYNWVSTTTTWDINLSLNWNVNIQWKNMSLNTKAEVILTLKKIYAKLSKIDANIPDPTMTSYITLAKSFVWKWFMIDNKINSDNYNNTFKNIKLLKQFKEYSLFKIDKKIDNLKYKVSLNNNGLAHIIYNIDKQADPKYSWNITKIAEKIEKSWNFNGILSLDKNKTYFSLSGNVASKWSITHLFIKYSNKKFIISTELFELNLNTNWNNFDWYLLIKQQWIKIDIKWVLSDKELELNIWYNLNPIIANIDLIYKAQHIQNINIKIPNNAINLQKAIWKY